MKLSAFTALLLLTLSGMAADTNLNIVKARTVYHANGTHTESTQDPSTREQTEFTYDSRNVLISKKVYLLNEKGQTTQGNVYDAKGELKARAAFFFDDLGRMIEQRMTTRQGEVYQSILFTYDARGVPLPPKSRTYSTNGPSMKASVIDFTNQGAAPAPMDRREPATPSRGNVPRLSDNSSQQAPTPPQNGTATPTDAGGEQAKKPGFWSRMLKGKKEEKK